MSTPTLKIPATYRLCGCTECPRSSTCLRHVAYRQLEPELTTLTLLNPRFLPTDGNCSQWRDASPVRFALGFMKMQERMLPAQYRRFKWTLMGTFGRSHFYERRNGTRAMPPKEQALVENAAREAGLTLPFEFDKYEDRYDWSEV